jgi:curli biogenesis system outer membrane secretion channel CsgG
MKIRLTLVSLLAASLLMTSCKQPADVTLPVEAPKATETSYSQALKNFGRLTREFRVSTLRVQTTQVQDETGSSAATGAEIPFDITKMIMSAINGIGGSIQFIPYDPVYIKNQAALNMTTLEGKMKPEIVLNGGITEFDRSIESGSSGLDFGGSFGAGKNSPGVDMGKQDRDSVSSITIDLNITDVETMAMVPRVQAVNTMKVFKAASDLDIGFSIFGASFGYKSSIKKIQGRHAAVRVLVELSVLETLGKYLNLPYWKCVDQGAKPDAVVIENVRDQYIEANQQGRVRMIQNLLYVYGYRALRASGNLDADTVAGIKAVSAAYAFPAATLDENFYEQLFLNAPVLGDRSKVQGSAGAAAASMTLDGGSAAGASVMGRAASQNTQPGVPLSVDIKTDKAVYKQGEKIRITLKGNKDFYGKIVYLTADGQTVQLLPNGMRSLDFFKGGRTYSVPEDSDGFSLDVAPPYGAERIMLYASESPLPAVKTRSLGEGAGGMLSLPDGQKALNSLSRGIKISKTEPVKTVATESREAAPPTPLQQAPGASASVVERAIAITTKAR